MRDLALTALVVVLLGVTFKHPVVGAYLWAWLSVMNPHKLTYGFAFSMPFAYASAIVTLLALAFTKKRWAIPLTGMVKVQIALLVWMTLTCLTAYAPVEDVLDRWIFVMKIQVMLFATWMLVTEPRQLRTLIWIIALSVAFYGVKGGIFTVLTGGNYRVWGPPGGLIQGNNELAVALVMTTPMLYFLWHTSTRFWVRWGLVAAIVTCAFSILGSQSRGALLALVSMALFLGLKGKYPVRTSIAVFALVGLAIVFMPESWTSRMETIKTYEGDRSAMSRLWTWLTLWNAALDHPLTGVGFRADNAAVFEQYAPLDGQWGQFAGRVWVAHNIYLQVLGEHGFVGLFLFLLLGVASWITAGRVAARARDVPEYATWMPLLMRMVQVSLIGYATGGLFLSLAYVDIIYYTLGYVVSCDAFLRRRGAEATSARPAVGTVSRQAGG